MAAETLKQLKDILQSEIVRHERRKVAGRDAWVAETIGHEAGSTMLLHQLHIVFFTKTHRVAITASARPDSWSTIGPMFEEMIDGMTPAP